MNLFFRGSILLLGILCSWQIMVALLHLPPYILPTPFEVMRTAWEHLDLLANETIITILETLIGLALGILFACSAALSMTFFKPLGFWLLPIFIISQAIPTFAIAPLLVIWFGYGITAKIVVTILMVFFPITSAFYDGLRQTDSAWIDLAKTMNAKKWRFFYYVRIPAALPNLASGIRVATTVAPIGAVIGEWVGASQGLGFLMLNANARMQISLMFAGLFILIIFSLLLYFIVNQGLKLAIPWQARE